MAKRTKAQVAQYPEKGVFTEQKALKKHIKGLTDEQLSEWVGLEGLTYKACDDKMINRMRMAMAINEYHFPSPPKAAKAKSKYADYSTEDLVAMAAEHSVPVEVCEDAKILRMRTIMALRAAGKIG